MLNFQEQVCEFQDVKVDLKEIMRGCPIYTITGVQPPFINPENSTLKGVLLEMMDAFGEASDRTIIYRPYDPIYMDEIVESYTFESMIESFQSGYADLFIGAVQLSAMSVIDIGPLIIANDLLIVAPRELVRDMTEFINQPQKLHVFGRWTTGVLLIVISFKFLIRWSADKNLFPSFVQIFFMVFRTILNVPTACRIPKNTLVRIFLISILFYCMGFSSYLQGTLISIMNGPTYEPPVSDLKGLLDKGTPIVLNAGMAIFFQYMDLPYFQNVYDKHIPMLEKDLFDNVNVLLVKRNFATVIYKGYLIMKPNLEKSFSIFDLWPNAHVPAMPKKYFMHREFCYWFDQMVEFGIIQKFWRLYEFYYAKESVSAMSRMYQVRLEQFLPVLILWASGCCLAIFCFILEVIVHYLHRIILSRKYYIASD
ncbi:uncharacterized protein LOC126734237 [Anthonomus grandis grandis]|uniref:uncharacterized protein LOC126734237 n=1 Tax=Anthonomus grandis grandis TaxID=2921223 RepID=UPI0021655ED1|nr:uncharacterized protein LOC126734237 [Anthonomus grandis grandis]